MKLKPEDKKKITIAVIKEYAKDIFIKSDVTIEALASHINSEYGREFSTATIHSWVVEGYWDDKRSEHKKKEVKLQEKTRQYDLKKEADNKDYEKICSLVEVLEEKFYINPNAKDLVAIIAGMKYARELRTSALVDETHNEISVILAQYNQTIINTPNAQTVGQAKEELVFDLTKELVCQP